MSTTLALRDYQEEALDSVNRELAAGNREQLLVLPTGAGKTVHGPPIGIHSFCG